MARTGIAAVAGAGDEAMAEAAVERLVPRSGHAGNCN